MQINPRINLTMEKIATMNQLFYASLIYTQSPLNHT